MPSNSVSNRNQHEFAVEITFDSKASGDPAQDLTTTRSDLVVPLAHDKNRITPEEIQQLREGKAASKGRGLVKSVTSREVGPQGASRFVQQPRVLTPQHFQQQQAIEARLAEEAVFKNRPIDAK